MSEAAQKIDIKVSAYDRVSSLLVSLLILVGTIVVVLFLIWFSARVLIVPTAEPVPLEMVELLEYGGGRGDHDAGFGRDAQLGTGDIDEPSEAQTPSASDATGPAMAEAVAALDAIATDVADTMAASDAPDSVFAAPSTGQPATVSGDTYGVGTGRGVGIGDSRRPGALGEGRDDIVPPWERWEIRFTTTGLQLYAKQLDYFKVELGAVGGGNPQVDYAYNLTKSTPDRKAGKPEAETRLYMTWRDERNPIAVFDRQLLEKAGINTKRRLVLQFFTKAIEHDLLVLEAQRAKGHDPRSVLKTIFAVREVGPKFEFYLVDQLYRPVH